MCHLDTIKPNYSVVLCHYSIINSIYKNIFLAFLLLINFLYYNILFYSFRPYKSFSKGLPDHIQAAYNSHVFGDDAQATTTSAQTTVAPTTAGPSASTAARRLPGREDWSTYAPTRPAPENVDCMVEVQEVGADVTQTLTFNLFIFLSLKPT